MGKKILLISLLLSSHTVFAGTLQGVENALKNYCIPIPDGKAYDGKPVCSSVFEGVYNGTKSATIKCDCEVSKDTPYQTGDGKFLSYSTSLRRCAPKCSAGFYPAEKTSCPTGTYRDTITRTGVDSSGTKIFECTSCGNKSCSLDGMSCTSCIGNGVATCNPTNCAPVTCSPGYGLSNGKCVLCSAGQYSSGGTMACTPCKQTIWGNWYNKSSSKYGTSCGTLERKGTAYCGVKGSNSSTANSYTVYETTTKTCSGGSYCSSGKCCHTDSSGCSSCQAQAAAVARACAEAKSNCPKQCANQSSGAQQSCAQMCANIQCDTVDCSSCATLVCE